MIPLFENQHPVKYSLTLKLWDIEVCFLHVQLMGTSVRLPKIHEIHPEVDSKSSVTSKIVILEWTLSAVLNCITHITILSTIVWWILAIKQAETSVTSSCFFGYCASKLVCGPKNVKSTTSSQVPTCQDNVWANYWQVSNWFEVFLHTLMIIQARSWTCLQVICLWIANSQRFLRTSAHVRFLPCW